MELAHIQVLELVHILVLELAHILEQELVHIQEQEHTQLEEHMHLQGILEQQHNPLVQSEELMMDKQLLALERGSSVVP